MQEIEVTGTIDQQGYIQLDHPLTISDRKNVRIILLIPEIDEDNKTAASEPPNLFGFLPKRADPLTFQQEMRDEWNR
jgi:hypothetical protein